MSDRLLRVNAYTTLDLADVRARGHDFDVNTLGVVNVTAPRKNPDHVTLQVEIDHTTVEMLPAHADEVTLSASEARTIADDLHSYADRVENAQSSGSDDA
ncbi:DUF6360 family protein [Haloquadratum walsbyi]|jgi:low affinity Fe/Cu permease|uniref:Uncharacterized protein n=1 Tax=Haloquadratum walsbyi (strain DSM 16854 / JCM 12705 / C23) TaxID=768065 RepID=G0LG97_HALWC|nr:DUF6360 family protein [Haloquadratum walsbyi]CCC39117.1 uncharacterized protein Hqrw_1147 [Haloquadratum walsbyi C23]